MTSGTDPVDELFAELIATLEEDPEADVERFLEGHASHAAALRKRIEKLRAAGFLGSSPQVGNLLHEMRERFGVRSGVRTLAAPRMDGMGPEQSELLPSRVIGGRYRILGELGRGGMGRVFRALDVDLDREVALKVADLEEVLPGAGTPQKRVWIERFLSEAQVTAQLEHPSIVPVHDIGIDRTGQLFYTMKVVEGKTLARCIDDWHMGLADGRPFPTAELLRIVLQICNALAFAHERGVVHRDLKPSNVMVGRFGEVQVMDWGLAKLLGAPEAPAPPVRSARRGSSSPTRAGDVLGTPTHMAPEQAQGDSNAVDCRSDVFGIGAILHHALYGSPPNDGSETSSRSPSVSRSWKVPPELEAVCHQALHPDPMRRYQLASELGDDLRASLDQRVVRAYETGAVAELRKWIRRNRALAAALGAAILALIAGLVATQYLKKQAEARGDDVLRLSALQDLSDLPAEADRLWPPGPEQIEGYRLWIGHAQKLVQELPRHRAKLEELRSSEDREGRWWSEQLEKLVHGLEQLEAGLLAEDATAPDHGWSVPRRLRFAELLSEGFRQGGEYSNAWERALPSIRAAYGGLEIEAQMGLVPLGPDPRSGLWEFAHLQSGAPAQRDGRGQLIQTEETGLVLVLLPGGAFEMGAQSADSSSANYDPLARPDESPVHSLGLSPFFLSKYEMTQGQWQRVVGMNPSQFGPHNWSPNWSADHGEANLMHPIEVVSWDDCVEVVRCLDLVLPTEAQWEYAARAGTDTPWWTGSKKEELTVAANLADRFALEHGGEAMQTHERWLDDGHTQHARVGTYRPNGFGFHEMIGNVWEWVRDGYGGYELPSRAVDGERIVAEPSYRVGRGGGFSIAGSAGEARSAFRNEGAPGGRYEDLGLRPARNIQD